MPRIIESNQVVRAEDGELIYGMYYPSNRQISVYIGSLKAGLGPDECLEDLKELVILHEKAHALQHRHKMPFDEDSADVFAVRRFVMKKGRRPNVTQWK